MLSRELPRQRMPERAPRLRDRPPTAQLWERLPSWQEQLLRRHLVRGQALNPRRAGYSSSRWGL